jgi:DNA-binding transcriptional ArsR family regulator
VTIRSHKIQDVFDDDSVFKALADPTRRFLLDLLFKRDGRTLTELESELAMTRFGVMKHLRVLERAGVVVTRRSGIDKYTERRVSALLELKNELEAKAWRQSQKRA